MAQWTREEVVRVLHEKIKDELSRLSRRKLQMTPYSIAHTIGDFVLAMMSDSRRKEILRLRQLMERDQHFNMDGYLEERYRELKQMSTALNNFAIGREKERLGK